MKLTVKTNLEGDQYVDHVSAWCFEFGNDGDESVLRYIPKDQCYAVAGETDKEDPKVRPYHKDVWCAKQKNLELLGKFKTLWEIEEELIETIKKNRQERRSAALFASFE